MKKNSFGRQVYESVDIGSQSYANLYGTLKTDSKGLMKLFGRAQSISRSFDVPKCQFIRFFNINCYYIFITTWKNIFCSCSFKRIK